MRRFFIFLLAITIPTVFTLKCTVCDLKLQPPHNSECNKTCEGDVCFILINKYFNGTMNAGCMYLQKGDSFDEEAICQRDRNVNRCACTTFNNCNDPDVSISTFTFTDSPVMKNYSWFQQFPASRISSQKLKAFSIDPDYRASNLTNCGKRVVGTYTGWESAQITENQLRKMTHVIFLYTHIDSFGDVTFENYYAKERFLDMKKKARAVNSHLKVMVAVGWWTNTNHFSPLVADIDKRKNLIDSIAQFADQFEIDGVDIFWTYSRKEDKENYLIFIQELNKKLKELKNKKERKHHYILSVVVPPFIQLLEDGYDLNEIMSEVDFINVLSYDYFNPNGKTVEKFIGPISPLYGGTRGNVDDTMKYLVCKTKNPNKLNMAVLFYGTYWKYTSLPLNDTSDDIWKPDPYNRLNQILWRNLAEEGFDKTDISWNEKTRSSYIWNNKTRIFLGLETERSLREKMIYVNQKNFGGVTILTNDYDDDENTLLTAVSLEKMCSNDKKNDFKYSCDG